MLHDLKRWSKKILAGNGWLHYLFFTSSECLISVQVVVDQYRSTYRHCLVRISEEKGFRERMRALVVKYPRYGYQRVHIMLLQNST